MSFISINILLLRYYGILQIICVDLSEFAKKFDELVEIYFVLKLSVKAAIYMNLKKIVCGLI